MPGKLLWRRGKLVLELEAVIRVPIVVNLETIAEHARRKLDAIKLTKRERQTLAGLREGLGNKEIADRMNVSTRTVKFHVAALLRKFHAPDRYKLREMFFG